jgi:WD40 repeat protein
MVRDYRCDCGHAWAAAPGDSCPACGVTASGASDPTPLDGQTHVLHPAPDHDSFSSLAEVIPADPFAITRDVFSVKDSGEVPIGATQEFATSPVPGYEVFEELGRGGMGVVYRARQTGLNRPVALKMILAGSHAGPVERERFRREAQAVAALQHPNIVQIFEIGEAAGHPYLALELVDGGSLAQHLVGSPWPARDAVELVEHVARAVEYAHSQGVVHRDLKPGNILLAREKSLPSAFQSTRNSVPKITDFGLAKRIDETVAPDGATKTGAVMGTPSYIAPEQASGKTREIGPAADVYALGAILYELLTGRPPFRGETPLDTVLQVINEDPVSPKSLQSNVPWDVQTICLKCLMKSPAKRYASALALAEDLRRWLNGEPIQARPLGSWGRSVKWAKRHPALAVLGIGTTAATFAVLAVLSVAYTRVRDAKSQREHEALEAHRARAKEEIQRKRAEGLAEENEKARFAAVEQTEQLKRESERNRRSAYALQIAQIAAIAERDPRRAQILLEDPSRCPSDYRDFAWEYLHRLCFREDRAYREHGKGDELESIAVSKGGTFVATAGSQGEIRIWDPRTTRTFAVLVGHRGRIQGLAFSPDGGVLASAGEDGTVRLWEFPEDMLDLARRTMSAITFIGDFVRPFQLRAIAVLTTGKGVRANCVAFTPDGRTLVAGCSSGALHYWTFDAMRPNVLDIATVGGLGATGLWKLRQPNAPPRTAGAYGYGISPVRSIAFSDSGRMLAIGQDDRTVWVQIASEGRLFTGPFVYSDRRLDSHAGPIVALAFSPDERSLFTANNGARPVIRVYDTQTWKEDRRLIGHTDVIFTLAVSPDGTRLASGAADKSVRLWDLEEGRELATLMGHDHEVRSLAFGGDRRSVISVGGDGLVRVWNTAARANESADVTGRDTPILSASLDSNGSMFAFADGSGHILLRTADVVGGRFEPRPGSIGFQSFPVKTLLHSGGRCVAVAPNGHAVYAGTNDSLLVWRFLRLNSPKTKEPTVAMIQSPVPIVVPVPKPIKAMLVSPDSSHLATWDEDGVRLWKTTDFMNAVEARKAVPTELVKDPAIAAMAFHPNGKHLAVALENGVRVVDLDGKTAAELPHLHAAAVTTIAFDHDGKQLATASAEGVVKVWNTGPDLALTHQVDIPAHTGPATAIAFTPGGRTLATGGVDRNIVLWDPVTGLERLTLSGHVDRLLNLQFTANGRVLVSISRDGSVKRWRADPPPIGREPPPMMYPRMFPGPPPRAKKP